MTHEIPGPESAEDATAFKVDLAHLVHHRQCVEGRTPLAEVQKLFQQIPQDFFAITETGKVTGLCSRATVGFMLGSRYGFALYGSTPVAAARAPRPLICRPDAPLREVLDGALSRCGSEFFEDVVLVDEAQELLGLIPVPRLARLQLQLFGHQLKRAIEQDDALRQQNLELFQINHQLRQSQGRYKALFENNALGVALLDPHGAVVAHNRRFEQILRLEARPSPARFELGEWLVPPERGRLGQLLAALERQGSASAPTIGQFLFEFPGGAPRMIELHCSWVAETGQVCAFLEDITDQHALEQQLARQEKQNMLDTLVAGVAHELNNKLTPVLGFAELLEVVAPPSLRPHTQCIRQSSHEAAQIIKQLLNIARPADSDFALADLAALCREAAQMLRYQLQEHRCEMHLRLPSDAVWIKGDAAQLKQVLMNFILNALHAMEQVPHPELTLTVETSPEGAWLRVRDVGTGIKPEHLSRIFDPFFTTKGPRGTGLGLSISASIVRQHGGEIAVESVVGVGSTFSLRLPVQVSETRARPAEGRSVRPAHYDASRRSVLIVDDEEFVRQFMQEVLRAGFSCRIEIAADGHEAVEKLRTATFDLVLTDIRMPRLDGLQLRRWIEENRPELAERVVFVTGNAGALDLDSGLAHIPGAAVIRKPFTVDAIIGACRPYLVSAA
ncbi:MAG: response regulator [Candidatus Didemnitutus sp.]|nr:response regulator [Candidatus Didemnitutus sp.]